MKINSGCAFLLLAALLALGKWGVDLDLRWAVLVLAGLRTTVDYSVEWRFYAAVESPEAQALERI